MTRGYVILAEFVDADGKVSSALTQTRAEPPHLPHIGHSFAVGQKWTETLNIPTNDGKPVEHRVTIDYVLFENGSSWGEDKYHQSLKIQGVLTGFQTERARLRRLLSKRGSEAVAEDLQSRR